MKIQYIIMAHKDRREYLPYLKAHLGADTPVSLDRGDWGLVEAHRRAWGLADPSYDYTFVIQDDVELASNFLDKAQFHVDQGVENCGGGIAFHFYLRNSPRFRKKIIQWKKKKQNCVILPHLYSGNSIGIRSKIVTDMLDFFDTMDVNSGDQRINAFLNDRDIPVYFPLPNLCEHRNIPSLHSRNSSPEETRVSVWFEP